jgi:hypothetical protein
VQVTTATTHGRMRAGWRAETDRGHYGVTFELRSIEPSASRALAICFRVGRTFDRTGHRTDTFLRECVSVRSVPRTCPSVSGVVCPLMQASMSSTRYAESHPVDRTQS